MIEWQKVLILEPDNREILEFTGARKEGLIAERVKSLFEDGMRFYNRGELKKAIKEWEELLALDPAHEKAKRMIARARGEIEKILARKREEAERKRLAEERRKREAMEKKRREEKEREETAKKEEASKKGVYVPPVKREEEEEVKDVASLYSQGLQAYALGDLDKAINLWEKVLQLDPGHSRAKRNLERVRKEQESTQ